MIRVARIVLMASLALWVGGLATISFVLAPTAFKVQPSRQVAGQIVGASLRNFGVVELVCGVLAVSSSIFLRFKTGRGKPVVGDLSLQLGGAIMSADIFAIAMIGLGVLSTALLFWVLLWN